MEHWATFYEKKELYTLDGLNLRSRGTNLLGDSEIDESGRH